MEYVLAVFSDTTFATNCSATGDAELVKMAVMIIAYWVVNGCGTDEYQSLILVPSVVLQIRASDGIHHTFLRNK